MRKIITFEWEIYDTRDMGGFRTGTSTLELDAVNNTDAINAVIRFCESVPSWEFERNGINLEEYREGRTCCYHYFTKLSKVITITTRKGA